MKIQAKSLLFLVQQFSRCAKPQTVGETCWKGVRWHCQRVSEHGFTTTRFSHCHPIVPVVVRERSEDLNGVKTDN